MLFKLQKSNKKFGASLYQIYRTDTGQDFSLYFAYELLMRFRILYTVIPTLHDLVIKLQQQVIYSFNFYLADRKFYTVNYVVFKINLKNDGGGRLV